MQGETEPIKFYEKESPYYYFTNFYHSPFEVNGKIYPTNEHFFQSKKFEGDPFEKEVR